MVAERAGVVYKAFPPSPAQGLGLYTSGTVEPLKVVSGPVTLFAF